MKHKIGFNALSRKASQRKALKRNMVTSLFRYERVETTKAKALEVRRMAEKMITRAKVDSVENRRLVSADLYDEDIVNKLFTQIAPLYTEVNGGYTRVLKTSSRLGDAAQMVILELVKKTPDEKDKKAAKKEEAKKEAPKSNPELKGKLNPNTSRERLENKKAQAKLEKQQAWNKAHME
ncbi:MAG: 50S ribosomal protein L17 [Sphaerochaetaceae bacterium]|jgi:large subunit ribosomal protein L17|nr:50S ribosomal protein L17 [Sphaerochaetaceae bacterium]